MRLLRCAVAGLTAGLTVLFSSATLAKTPAADEPDPVAITDVEKCLSGQKSANSDRGICIGKASEACMRLPGGETTYGMMDCYKREIAVWDFKLNQTYQALLKTASPKLKATLKNAQRAWIDDKEKTCLIPYSYFEGGTIAGPLGGSCVQEMTARRFLLLDDYLHYAE